MPKHVEVPHISFIGRFNLPVGGALPGLPALPVRSAGRECELRVCGAPRWDPHARLGGIYIRITFDVEKDHICEHLTFIFQL